MNMLKPVKATSAKEYFENLPEDRKPSMKILHELILEAAPDLKVNFIYNMPGYGSFKYKNYKKELIDWPIISLANQKNYISIYVCSVVDGEYLAEKYKTELGKVSVGKSCIRIKELTDINLDVLKKVIKIAAKAPGLSMEGSKA